VRKLLYTSGEVRQAIGELFESTKGRRVAISAFVGEGAEIYLRNLAGLELYCWPKAGGTNPHVLRKLREKSVKISFVDGLHMKVYWAESGGAVVTSANLSTNALGSGNLKEIGVLLEPGELDIDRVIHSLRSRPASEKELKKLERDHRSYIRLNPGYTKTGSGIQSFGEWYESPWRSEWKLGLLEGTCETALIVKETLKRKYQIDSDAKCDLIAAPENLYRKDDWILTFKYGQQVTGLEWLYADFVVKVPKSDKKAYDRECPCQIVQVQPRKYYSGFPFEERDGRFKEAFSKAIQKYGVSKIKELKSCKPPKRLLDWTHSYLQKA